MDATFNKALKVAKGKYPHPINHYVEYKDYFVFDHDDGAEYDGGTKSPIVVRKSDMAALNFDPAFFWGLFPDSENAGEIVSEGKVA